MLGFIAQVYSFSAGIIRITLLRNWWGILKWKWSVFSMFFPQCFGAACQMF